MSSEPSDYVTRSGRRVKTPTKYSPTWPIKRKKMSRMTGHYKCTKQGRKSYLDKVSDNVTETLEYANLKTSKPKKPDDDD